MHSGPIGSGVGHRLRLPPVAGCERTRACCARCDELARLPLAFDCGIHDAVRAVTAVIAEDRTELSTQIHTRTTFGHIALRCAAMHRPIDHRCYTEWMMCFGCPGVRVGFSNYKACGRGERDEREREKFRHRNRGETTITARWLTNISHREPNTSTLTHSRTMYVIICVCHPKPDQPSPASKSITSRRHGSVWVQPIANSPSNLASPMHTATQRHTASRRTPPAMHEWQTHAHNE